MKQILLMIAVVALVGGCGTTKVVPIVEKAVRKELEKPEGELTNADLAKVTRLYLYGTKITDAGLKEVAKLQKLTHLNLYGTGITDAGLKEVAKLQNLTYLYLVNTKITNGPGLDELQKALRHCRIRHTHK